MKTLFLTLFLFCSIGFAQVEHLENDVASAGTAERISTANLQVRSVVIQAKVGNAGYIYVGDSGVDNSGDQGIALAAGDSYTLSKSGSNNLYNLYEIWIDAATSGDGVSVNYFRK